MKISGKRAPARATKQNLSLPPIQIRINKVREGERGGVKKVREGLKDRGREMRGRERSLAVFLMFQAWERAGARGTE